MAKRDRCKGQFEPLPARSQRCSIGLLATHIVVPMSPPIRRLDGLTTGQRLCDAVPFGASEAFESLFSLSLLTMPKVHSGAP